jgi:hypothetical protein
MKIAALLFLCLAAFAALAQQPAATAKPAAPTVAEISGMYSFLHDGEFVEIDVEDDGGVTGFISRFGDAESDRGAFLDQMFKTASLQGNKLSFTTREVHGVSYEFKGTVERGPGKEPGSEGYWVLKGTLTQTTLDAGGKPGSKSRAVEFKSFPADAQADHPKKD